MSEAAAPHTHTQDHEGRVGAFMRALTRSAFSTEEAMLHATCYMLYAMAMLLQPRHAIRDPASSSETELD